MTKEKKCTKCGEARGLEYFHKDKSARDGLQYTCKMCARERARKWTEENKERRKEYLQENKEYFKDQDRKWKRDNPDKTRAHTAKRRSRKLRATPKWLTEEQDLQIKLIYEEAKELEEADGIKRHTDHIVPLKSENVCGLHVPWNLQILTAEQNLSKNNRYSDWD